MPSPSTTAAPLLTAVVAAQPLSAANDDWFLPHVPPLPPPPPKPPRKPEKGAFVRLVEECCPSLRPLPEPATEAETASEAESAPVTEPGPPPRVATPPELVTWIKRILSEGTCLADDVMNGCAYFKWRKPRTWSDFGPCDTPALLEGQESGPWVMMGPCNG